MILAKYATSILIDLITFSYLGIPVSRLVNQIFSFAPVGTWDSAILFMQTRLRFVLEQVKTQLNLKID